MTMLAEAVDAVAGTGTHRDSHEVEIADAGGKPIVAMQIGNDSAGFAQLLGAIAEVAPGPRVAVCIEGSRSYGTGLARALAAAGLLVVECEQPSRKQRRGKGKSGPIDAHLAVLAALRLGTARLPVPRADGDREALRILLVARQEITAARTAQASRLRACCWPVTTPTARRPAGPWPARPLPPWPDGNCQLRPPANRLSARLRSFAWQTRSARPGASSRTTANSCWSSSMTSPPVSPAVTASGRSAPPRPSSASPTPAAAATRPRSPPPAAPAPSPPAAARPSGTGSTAAATAP
jgi:Transposase